ncbi:MAG TPA: dimethylsulfonioproprionate lyase family protein [Dongiaceae bacterium]|nr:dimethylsulfonioproprionate lyase family protein [Dongiaceae bacterium]
MTGRAPLADFLTAVRRLLAAAEGAAAPDAAVETARLAAVLSSIAAGTGDVRLAPAAGLGVCRWWDAALDGASAGPAASVADALRAHGPHLIWTQNPNYRRRPPDAGFLDNYGYAVIAGPAQAASPPLVVEHRLAMGVLLLGPGTHYPLHAHPAAELYLALGAGDWWRDAGPWRREAAGALIHHPPHMPHALRAGPAPLLAVYLWRGDLATAARLVGAD